MAIADRDAASLWDMVQAIQELQSFTTGMTYDDYAASVLVQRAVERELEIVGEAARRLSVEFCQSHPDIDWAGLVGLRNILAHRYDQIRCDRIWDILESNLPTILKRLQALLPPLPNSPEPDA